MNRFFCGLAVIFLWSTAPQAEPLADKTADMQKITVTEQQAVALFYQNNLSLLAAKFNIDSAQAQEIIAAAIPNPVFTFTTSTIPIARPRPDQRNAPLPAISPQVEQLIETAGKRRLRMESSALGTKASGFDLLDTTRVLTNAVRRSYYNLLLAQKVGQVANENSGHYQEILKANSIRLKAGDIPAIHLVRIEMESLKAQSEQDQAQAALSQARAELLLMLGWPENSMKIIAAEVWPEAKPEIALAKHDQLTERALEQRPDLRAARARIEQARKSLELAQRMAIPDVTVSAFFQRDPGNFITNSTGVGISVPLPLFYRQEGQIAKAGVDLHAVELQLQQNEQTIRAEIMKTLSAWQSADTIARRYETSVIQRIEALRKTQETAFLKGAVGLLDLIDTERNYKIMMLDYYAALAGRSKAWADLLMVCGEETRAQP